MDFYQARVGEDTCHIPGGYYSDCFTGLRFQKRYKEFAQVRLAEALHRGTTYEFEMHVRLAYWSNALVKSFGVLFTKGGYHGQGDAVKSCIIDSVCKKGGFINNYQWFTIKGKYKADGGEKYITIGNFFPKIEKDMIRINIFKLGFREAYYFVDEISLYKAKEPEEKVAVEYVGSVKNNEEDSILTVRKDIKVGEKVALKNIFFENGKYYLLPESYQELNKLAQYLIRTPQMQIQINGHSDNNGSKNKNQRLSELRAREVFEYLIKKGVQNKCTLKVMAVHNLLRVTTLTRVWQKTDGLNLKS
ncbi:MAG: OmpA family protein [Sphingobacteriaceae bacterium]|nr:OmpA family protein [Sphingobacteriaceae bacterium]